MDSLPASARTSQKCWPESSPKSKKKSEINFGQPITEIPWLQFRFFVTACVSEFHPQFLLSATLEHAALRLGRQFLNSSSGRAERTDSRDYTVRFRQRGVPERSGILIKIDQGPAVVRLEFRFGVPQIVEHREGLDVGAPLRNGSDPGFEDRGQWIRAGALARYAVSSEGGCRKRSGLEWRKADVRPPNAYSKSSRAPGRNSCPSACNG